MRLPTRELSRATAAALALFAALAPARAHAGEDLAGLLRDAQVAQSGGRLGDASALYVRAHHDWPQDLDAARGACEVGLKVAGDAPISAATGEACHKAFLATKG